MGDIARNWIAIRVPIGLTPVKITDNSIHKNCVLIRNIGPGVVYIYPNQNANSTTGFPMVVGDTLTVGVQDKAPEIPGWEAIEIWGICDNATGPASEIAGLAERI